MKKIINLLTAGMLATLVNAEVVTYNFDLGLGDSTSGTVLTAGDVSYAVGTQSDGSPNSSERAWDQTSTSGNYLLNFGQRGIGNGGVDDSNLTITGAATLQFTLTPNSGDTLDFSTSTLTFDQSVYSNTGTNNYAYKIWADTGSGFVAVGTLQTTGNFAYSSGSENRLLQADETTDLPGFSLTGGIIQSKDTAFSFELSSLAALTANQSVTFAIAMSSNRNNQTALGNGIDNLVINLDVSGSDPAAPVANADAYDIAADVAFSKPAPGVLENDTDANGDSFTAVQRSSPTNGTLTTFSSDGAFVYQPNSGFIGTDSFTYEATDGGLTSSVVTVTLTVGYPMTVANIFSDNMVLQRNETVRVWGKSNPGELIEVSFATQTTSTMTNASGDWNVFLDPMPANATPATLSVTSPRANISFTNLLVGDVWVCSGQSNMDRSLNKNNPNVDNWEAEVAAANYPNIRLMDVPVAYSTNPLEDLPAQASWEACSPATVGAFSGTGYFFGRKIHLETGVPIGLIESAAGGTRIERWMPEDLRTEIGYTYNDQITELYNGMIHPLSNFPIKGAIWYQGESNGYDGAAELALYKDKLESMIFGWRDAWGIGEFPVYFAQIAPHTRSDGLKLPTLWDAFTRTLSVPNTGMIVLNDLSQPGDITQVHPSNKQDVGLRFGLMALEKTYGGVTDPAYTGPLFDSAVATGSSVRVHFEPDTLGSGLASRDALPLILFELAGADQVYHANATATIDGNTVLVSHASVATPAFIRFGYDGNTSHNFMNTEGFPADTFAAAVVSQSPPVAHPDTFDVSAGGTVVLDFLANDTDVEGNPLTATVVDSPQHGTLVENNGTFSYTPTIGFLGTDRFTYMANDGTDNSQVVTVSVSVIDSNYSAIILPSMLGSNMVLQRNKPIPVWGWGPVGQTVSVALSSGQNASTVVNVDGTWQTTLPAMPVNNGPLSMLVSTSGSSATLTNLAIGDVWLSSGQSNSGWRLVATDGGPEEVAIANRPMLRHFYTSKHPSTTPIDNIVPETEEENALNRPTAEWTVCTPDVAGGYSAIAYYYGRNLQQELNIPIGIIQSAYAGTAVEAWTKSVLPNAQPDGSIFVPAHELFNGMIHPWLKTPISGMIWRQGDGNRRDGINYAEKVKIMVEEWRTLWGVGDFPFYYAQNPTVFTYEEDPTIPLFWEGQTEIMNVLTNSKMVIISDLSDGSNVHPRNKAPVGTRLADRALHNTYGLTNIFESYPIFSSFTVEGSQMRIHFNGTGSGLAMGTKGSTIPWFEICGTDGIFTDATATIDGHTVLLSAPSVTHPIGVRYLWSKLAIGNLFNIEGLPANSFRFHPPLAHGDSYGLHMDGELYVEPAGILGNDETGSNRLPLQRPILRNNVANGTLMLRDDGAFIYEPNTGFTGIDSFTYTVTDGAENSPETTVNIEVFASGAATGQINRDVWTGISGFSVGDLTSSPNYPNTPDERGLITALDAPQNWGNDYGQRLYGYLHPPTNGDYTFYISSSARSEFWLSTDDTQGNKVKICSSLDRTPGDWSAATASVSLVAGQRYYIEVLHKENSGADHVQVAWDLAGLGTTTIIDGAYLSGFPVAVPDTNDYAGWSSWYGATGGNEDDPDGDGVNNLLEYFVNSDPWSSGAMGITPTVDASDRLGINYKSAREVEPGDIIVTVEGSNDLGITDPWLPVPATHSVSGSGPYIHQWNQDTAIDAGGKSFIRLRITQQ